MINKYTPEAITLTLYNKEASTYGVCWQTVELGTPILEYTSEDDVDFDIAVRVMATAKEYNGMIRNTAEIVNVMPGKKYRYRVGDISGEFSEASIFTAVDPASEELCFLVFADTQYDHSFGEWWRAAWEDGLKRYPDAALMLHSGDIVQDGGDRELWSHMLESNRELVTSIPMLPTAGNHEYAAHHFRFADAKWVKETLGVDSDGYANIYSHYNILVPHQNIERGIYYSVNVGPVHFTVLDSGDAEHMNYCGLTSEQIEWALNDLAEADKKWKIVMLHNPMYSIGKYGSRRDLMENSHRLREQLNKAFSEYGVDLVISGHDHLYSETYPILADGTADHDCVYAIKKIGENYYRTAIDPRGAIHMLPGCTGNQGRQVANDIDENETANYRDYFDISCGFVSYAAVRVNGEILTVDLFINRAEDGENIIRRNFAIKKNKNSI